MTPQRPGFWPDRPWVVGHRGAARQRAENTQASFDTAVAVGADMVELDVRRSADGVLFVYHDATLPVTNERGVGARLRRVRVESLTYSEICTRVAGMPHVVKRGRLHGGEAPPRFDDVVRSLRGRVMLDVEIKGNGYEREVLDVLAREAVPGTYVITSFRENVVATCKRLAPAVPVGLLLGTRGRGRSLGLFPFRRAEACNADFIVPHHVIADAALLARAQRRGVPVMVYTVNRQRRLEALLADGRVAGVITDVPDVAVRIRDHGPGL